MTTMQTILLAVLLFTNVTSFVLMDIDKRRAKKRQRRIPEKTLFLATICFGGLGGVLGMQLCRHKTKHWYFALFFPVILLVQVLILIYVWQYL